MSECKECLSSRLTSKHPQVAHLEVVIPPRIVDDESSTDLAVPEGGSVKLQCAAEGFPA